MNIHQNARLTPLGREHMVRAIVEGGQTPQAAARAAGVCPRTARKWVDRFRTEGLAGLADRSSRPRRLRQPTSPAVVDQVIALRRRRFLGQHIAKTAAVSPATVSRILERAGLSRLKNFGPPEPVRRYERQHPGELIHIDIKKLGRFHQVGHRITGDRTRQSSPRGRGQGAGWEFVHVCIDDASRIAFTRIMPDEKAKSAICTPFGELDTLVPAFATTIHKSQGSEYPAVVIPVTTQHYTMLARNLLYTGVTRGKKLVVLIAQRKAVAIAVRGGQMKRRWTKLRERLATAR